MPDRILRDGRWMVIAHMEHPAGSARQACSGGPLEEIPDLFATWPRLVCLECRAAVAEARLAPDLVRGER